MKRFVIICSVATLLALAGCNSSSKKDRINDGLVDSSVIYDTAYIEPWIPYVGSIPTTSFEGMLEVEVDTDGTIVLFDNQYYKLEISNDPVSHLFPESGWRINLDEMVPFGVEEQDIILMIPKREEHWVICTIDTSSNNVLVYFREDVAKAGVSYFDYSQFDIYYDSVLLREDTCIEHLWDYHTQAKDNVLYGMLMEECPDNYSLTFVHKENPVIQYELQFRVWDDMLCIDNIDANEQIYIPMDQFLGIEGNLRSTGDVRKTGDGSLSCAGSLRKFVILSKNEIC